MVIDVKKIKLQKINKYKMPVYNYPDTYKILYARSELRKAITNVEKAKVKPVSKKDALNEFYGLREATREEIGEYFRKKLLIAIFQNFWGTDVASIPLHLSLFLCGNLNLL